RRNWATGGVGAKSDYITFTEDGRFHERGFMDAAVANAVQSGQAVWFDPLGGGEGTFRLSSTNLELHYTSYNGTPQNGKINVPFHPTSWDPGTGVVKDAVLNTRYAFVRTGP